MGLAPGDVGTQASTLRAGRRTVGYMAERAVGRVTVPHVVGMPFHVGRDIASAAGVTLANPDSDGPPIGALPWPGLFYITSQYPEAGTVLYRWDSVVVEIVEHGDAESHAFRDDSGPPPRNTADAAPEHDLYIDLTDRPDNA